MAVPFLPMRFLAVFAFIAVAEMATFFLVESRIGLGWALGLAFLTALVGSFLVRRAGISVLGRIQSRLGQGRLPGRELSDGASILVAGAFLISPGFITDVLGFLLLIPAVRGFVFQVISKRLSARFTIFDIDGPSTRGDSYEAGGPGGGQFGDVIDVDEVE